MGSRHKWSKIIIRVRKILLVLWLFSILAFWTWVLIEDINLSSQQISVFLQKFQHYIILGYILLWLIRAFTLVPNMLLVVAASAFIKNYWVLLIISITGFLISSSIIYFFGSELGLGEYFERKFPGKISKIEHGLERYGAIIIILWGFLPIVPSDLLAFFLGSIKFPYFKFLLYYFTGHLIIYSILIFFGQQAWAAIFHF